MQLPLAHSGWLFKEEDEEADVKPWLPGHKEEDMDVDGPAVKGTLCQLMSPFLFCACPTPSLGMSLPDQLIRQSSRQIQDLATGAKFSLSAGSWQQELVGPASDTSFYVTPGSFSVNRVSFQLPG